MFRSYLKIAVRNLLKRKGYAFINIAGLALGMTAFFLISLYVWNERSYDNFHIKKDRVFRVRQDRYSHGELTRQWTAGPWGIGPDLKSRFPEVVRYVCVNKGGMRSAVLANGEKFFEEDRVLFASADFFKIFSFPLVRGIDSLVLRNPFTMVVSESLAKRYFGNADPIGKTLKCNGKEEYEIAGVFKDVPDNTHLKFDALFSFESLLKIVGPAEAADLMSSWAWAGNYTYVELSPTANSEIFQAKLPAYVTKEISEFLRKWDEGMAFVLQPVSSIHLNSNFKDELEPNGDARTVNILSFVAVFILMMAWINYVNLSTARSVERAKEVGIRKILGGHRSQIVRQFVLESVTIKLLAVLVSAVLVGLLLPHFSSFVGRKIDVSVFASMNFWVIGACVFMAGVMISGFYPALMMSAFRPISILKGKFQASATGNYIRKGLVIFQFVSSVVLIAGTFTAYRQIQFMRNSSLGFDKEQMLIVQGPNVKDSASYGGRFSLFRQSLLEYPEIRKIGVSSDVPGKAVGGSNGGVRLVGQDPKMGNSYRVVMVNEDFIETYGMKLVAGRTFSQDFNEHWKSAMVNETAMKLLGFTDPEKAIGQKIHLWDATPEIVGVLKDYHQESLKKRVDQLIFVCDREIQDYYSIKIKSEKTLAETVRKAEAKYKEAFPGNPFHYFFLDDFFNRQYQSDQQFGKVFGLFTLLAILIACLGLFGLSSYLVLQRTWEIGIRKVLGASVKQIALLVSKEFVLVVIIANAISWPVSYFLINNWLNGFAYRINLGLLNFLIPTVITLFIAILTVASQSTKAAMTNPVDSLRSE